jgi:glycosyltransferase involved in cell wall biosynthesis
MLTYTLKQYTPNPFLTIVTRKYKRPIGFSKNQQSILSLKDKDIEQIFITDNVGVGVHRANQSFSDNQTKVLVSGQYVFLLDDDDFISNPEMVSELKTIAAKHNPDVIFFRMIIKNNMHGNLYPTTASCWGVRPIIARIGGSCFVVKRDVWLKYIHEFGKPRCGDFYFIDAVFNSGVSVYWLDVLMCETGKVSRGAAE